MDQSCREVSSSALASAVYTATALVVQFSRESGEPRRTNRDQVLQSTTALLLQACTPRQRQGLNTSLLALVVDRIAPTPAAAHDALAPAEHVTEAPMTEYFVPVPMVDSIAPAPAASSSALAPAAYATPAPMIECIAATPHANACRGRLHRARSTSANYDFGQLFFSSSANSTSANFDFGQFRLRPISTSGNFWMLNFGTTKGGAPKGGAQKGGAQKARRVEPRRVEPRRVEPRRVEPRRVEPRRVGRGA